MLGQETEQVAGRDVYGADGAKIGTACQVYTDDQTSEPAWVTVRTGSLGLKESFVPLADAEMFGDHLTVPYSKDFVKDAPNIDEDGHLTPVQEQELYAYYGRTAFDDIPGAPVAGRTGRGNFEAKRTGRGTYVSGRTGRGDLGTHDRDDDTVGYASGRTEGAMTVSEERLHEGKQRRESGRARLRKYVVTDHIAQTVPVQREEARVRLDTETVTDQQRVAEEVRREQVDLEAHTRGSN